MTVMVPVAIVFEVRGQMSLAETGPEKLTMQDLGPPGPLHEVRRRGWPKFLAPQALMELQKQALALEWLW